MPTARYKITGTVINVANQQPLEGIQVGFNYSGVLTDATGSWTIDEHLPPCTGSGASACSLFVADVDGTAGGGRFIALAYALQLVQTEGGDGDMHLGTWEQDDILIQLVEQQP